MQCLCPEASFKTCTAIDSVACDISAYEIDCTFFSTLPDTNIILPLKTLHKYLIRATLVNQVGQLIELV